MDGQGLTRIAAVVLTTILAWTGLPGCQTAPDLEPAGVTLAPYDQSHGELLWAVAPLRNESATTTVDPLTMSDRVVEAIEQVKGIRCLPMNRTLETMRVLRIPMIRTPAEANKLADALGVDALVVGAITAYDPYDPRIGMALSLVPRTVAMNGVAEVQPAALDSRKVQASPTEVVAASALGEPSSSVSALFDGKNQSVQMDVRTYAEGRADKGSAAGWRRYLRSVDLFSEFAAFRLVDQLVQKETIRLARLHPNTKQKETKKAHPPVADASAR